MKILHDVIRFLHAEFFIERHRVFIGDEVNGNVLFAARRFVRGLHQTGADAPPFVLPVHAEIGDEQPVGKIGQSQQRADNLSLFIERG